MSKITFVLCCFALVIAASVSEVEGGKFSTFVDEVWHFAKKNSKYGKELSKEALKITSEELKKKYNNDQHPKKPISHPNRKQIDHVDKFIQFHKFPQESKPDLLRLLKEQARRLQLLKEHVRRQQLLKEQARIQQLLKNQAFRKKLEELFNRKKQEKLQKALRKHIAQERLIKFIRKNPQEAMRLKEILDKRQQDKERFGKFLKNNSKN